MNDSKSNLEILCMVRIECSLQKIIPIRLLNKFYENTESHIPIIIIISLECMYNLPTEYTKNEIEHEKGTYHDERHKI